MLGQFKTKKAFEKWVDETTAKLKMDAYENRDTIWKRELENELTAFASLKYAWDKIKALRKKSEDYDLYIFIDKKGYHRFEFLFPIAQEQFNDGLDYREKRVKELNRNGFQWGSACISQDEAVSHIIRDSVRTKYPFLDIHPKSECVFERSKDRALVRRYVTGHFKEVV